MLQLAPNWFGTLRKLIVNVEASLRDSMLRFPPSAHIKAEMWRLWLQSLNHIIFPTIKHLAFIIFISAFPHPPSFLPPLKFFCCILLHMQGLLLSKHQIYSLYLSLTLLVLLVLLSKQELYFKMCF